MKKVLISIPDQPIEEVTKRENLLYECAVAVEKDSALRHEMKDWDVTLQDGLDHESW